MKKQYFFLLFLTLTLALSPHAAQAKKKHHTPHHAHHGAGVDSSAGYSDIVIDADSGHIIHDVDGDDLRHPASLTKMMTLYITFQALESGRIGLNQYMTVSENAASQSPSKLGLHPGQHIRVEDAILGVVTESANDAAVVLGETLGGSEEGFAHLMTQQARALGMAQTIYKNPSGLPDPDQITTAHDMAILGAALIHHYQRFYPYFSHDSFTYAGIYHHNHNHLMDRYDGMDGIKTGYIRASGFNLVASAKRNGIRLIGVVFGGRSAVARDNHMAQLLDQSFDVAQSDARNNTVSVAIGEGDANDAGAGEYVTLPAKVAAVFPPHPGYAPSSQQQDEQDNEPEAAPEQQPAPTPVQVPKPASDHPTPVPKPASYNNKWGIQIGAYSDASIGQQALSGLTTTMPALASSTPQIEKVSAGGVVMFRARLMNLDQKTAQNVCSYLIQHSKSCLTVSP